MKSFRQHLTLLAAKMDAFKDVACSLSTFEAIEARHQTLAEALPTWLISHKLITPHPLGGCKMGATGDQGVVNHEVEVFGYKN